MQKEDELQENIVDITIDPPEIFNSIPPEMAIAYEQTFDLISSISLEMPDINERRKITKTALTLVRNIIGNPDEEKYRRLKLSNVNIQKLFSLMGVYEFFIFLGFKEKFIDNDIFLYLEREEYNEEIYGIVYSYMNLLINCDEEENDNVYIDPNSSELENEFYPSYEEVAKQSLSQREKPNKKRTVIDILKETKNVRGGVGDIPNSSDISDIRDSGDIKPMTDSRVTNSNTSSNYNSYISFRQSNSGNTKDIKTILKETADVRKGNSGYIFSNINTQGHISNDRAKVMTLRDLEFQNPDSSSVNQKGFKINDEVGKKCLLLTNDFRKKNGLSAVQWDDDIWKAAYGHSENMGIHKVPFGHEGFNQRISQLPFYYSQACENVFMCQGYSQYNLADLAVNGWINSPGHRKNLLSYTSHCAIAVYRNGYGEYYLTQIFVRK